MDAKETLKYLYEHGRIIGSVNYKIIEDELTENAKLKERGNEKARLLRLEVQEAVEALIGCEHDEALKILEQALGVLSWKDKDNG